MLSARTRRVYLKSGNKYAKTWGKKQRNKSPQLCQKLYIKPVGELEVGLVPWAVRSLNDWICKRTHVQTPPWDVHSSKPSLAAEVPGRWHFLGLTAINSYNKAQYRSCRRKHTQTPNHKPGNVPLQIPPSLHKAPRYTQLDVVIPRFHHFSSAQGSSCPLPPCKLWN